MQPRGNRGTAGRHRRCADGIRARAPGPMPGPNSVPVSLIFAIVNAPLPTGVAEAGLPKRPRLGREGSWDRRTAQWGAHFRRAALRRSASTSSCNRAPGTTTRPDGPGPGFFPSWYGVAMVVLSLALIVSRLRSAHGQATADRLARARGARSAPGRRSRSRSR